MRSPGPQCPVCDGYSSSTLFLFFYLVYFFFLSPKRVTEAIHLEDSGKYMIWPHVTVNPLDDMAAVTVP